MYCIRCGKQLNDDAKYCIYCGASTVTKAAPHPQSDQASGIPEDFDIALPKDFITPTAPSAVSEDGWEVMEIVPTEQPAMVPDGIESDFFTQAVPSKAAVSAEPVPDEIEDEAFTQVLSASGKAAEISAEPEETAALTKAASETPAEDTPAAMPDAIESEEFTRVVARDSIKEAMHKAQEEEAEAVETPLADIPDIPIPQDFISAPPAYKSQRRPVTPEYTTPPYASQPAYHEPEGDPDQMLSGRGLIAIILVIVLLFGIALGACILVLRGDTVSVDEGSAAESTSSDVGFWSANASGSAE